ncbi:ArdC family protein [Aureimonas sp. N4]|uniref:ArdC family protein n=1 Tax=Aureimonas sp. N4 TaxID=1638165 RepID=UPI0007817128|nr:zincin-like metallopeptidase domain-containing protein [Aureimonas sp. N4]
MTRIDVYQRVTDKIVAQLEQGVRPWMQPWGANGNVAQRPLRANGEPYRGMNTILLWMEAQANGYCSSHWMTYRQAAALGGQVRKGEKAALVVYANAIARTETDDNGNESERRIPFMKGYSVFNCDQIDNLPEQFRPAPTKCLDIPPKERIEAADAFFSATGAIIRHGGSRAFYSPAADCIQMPPFDEFFTAEGYAATLAHEMVHWTKHETRLARDLGRKTWGDEGYAREELVAEIGSAYLAADLDISIEPPEDHASYLESWLRVLKNDKRAIFQAASMAEKAASFLHSLQPGYVAPSETDRGGETSSLAA